jgi:hypothetical protein
LIGSQLGEKVANFCFFRGFCLQRFPPKIMKMTIEDGFDAENNPTALENLGIDRNRLKIRSF